jgi:hypothetical protein
LLFVASVSSQLQYEYCVAQQLFIKIIVDSVAGLMQH